MWGTWFTVGSVNRTLWQAHVKTSKQRWKTLKYLPSSSLWKSDAKLKSRIRWLSMARKTKDTYQTRSSSNDARCIQSPLHLGGIFMSHTFLFTHSFRSILAQGTPATWCTPVKFTKHCLTHAIKSEDERIAKGKQPLRLYTKYPDSLLLTVRHN